MLQGCMGQERLGISKVEQSVGVFVSVQ